MQDGLDVFHPPFDNRLRVQSAIFRPLKLRLIDISILISNCSDKFSIFKSHSLDQGHHQRSKFVVGQFKAF